MRFKTECTLRDPRSLPPLARGARSLNLISVLNLVTVLQCGVSGIEHFGWVKFPLIHFPRMAWWNRLPSVTRFNVDECYEILHNTSTESKSTTSSLLRETDIQSLKHASRIIIHCWVVIKVNCHLSVWFVGVNISSCSVLLNTCLKTRNKKCEVPMHP